MKRFFLLAIFSLQVPLALLAQKSEKLKISKVAASDFSQKIYPVDSFAHAVVLFDIGETKFVGNYSGDLSLTFHRKTRIHILNKNAYDLANVEVYLYYRSANEMERLEDVSGTTYNLENGEVVTSKLDRKKSIFSDQLDKNYHVEKFTLPNVKEGSIIEYEYTLRSDFTFNLQPWTFQGDYPILWSEYNASIPDFFKYVVLNQGYRQFDIRETEDASSLYTISNTNGTGETQREVIHATTTNSRWVMKNVPAMKPEAYVSSIQNHLAKITFQYKGFQPARGEMIDKMGDYPTAAKRLLERENFGSSLSNNNGWINDEMDPVLAKAKTDIEKATSIYNWVRDHFTCTDHTALYLEERSLKNLMRNKKGSVAEINILLTAILKHYNLNANPVILSTRKHGLSNSIYPLMDKFNYVIAEVKIDSSAYFMDASDPLLGFGYLPLQCYNFHAREVTPVAMPLNFDPELINETKNTSIFFSVENGIWGGAFQQKNGYYASYGIRESIKEKGKQAFWDRLKKGYNIEELTIKNMNIDSLDLLQYAVDLQYEFEFKPEDDQLVYLNPMFDEAWRDNPFKSLKRQYPVEMPYTMDEVYVFNFGVPEDYEIDELPKSIKLLFNESDGFFEYILAKSGNNIQLRSRIKLARATFEPEEYAELREFFAMIVKKHAEQIILKKKK